MIGLLSALMMVAVACTSSGSLSAPPGGAGSSTSQIRATSPKVRVPSPMPRGGVVKLPTAWSRIAPNEGIFGPDLEMVSVTAGGPGLVAVGLAEFDGRMVGHTRLSDAGAIWTSEDGVRWRHVPQSETGYGEVLDVAAGTNGLVAVGADGMSANAVVWTSSNGLAWKRLPTDTAALGRGIMSAVTPFGSGFVAVGNTITYPNPGQEEDRPAAWVSVDGTTWQRRVIPGGPNAIVNDVVSFGGRLFAVGDVGGPDPRTFVAAVWSSKDGRVWARTAHFPASFGSAVLSIAAGRNGLIATGRTRQVALWSSSDGAHWRRVPPDPAVFFDPQPVPKGSVRVVSMGAVAGGPAGYVAIGNDTVCVRRAMGCAPGPVVVWTSPDGQSWVRRPGGPAFVGGEDVQVNGLTAWRSRFVAIGADAEGIASPGPRQAAVWMSNLA